MPLYEATSVVDEKGQVRIAGVPLAPGTEVEVIINPKRLTAEVFQSQWKQVCSKLQEQGGDISDNEIQSEIDAHRAGN